MSGLEAFGLACNVMQTIGFAIEMASVCHTIFRTGSPDPSKATLLAHSAQITTSLKNSILSAKPVTRDEKDLLDIANKCLDAISTLRVQVDKLTRPSAKGKVLPSLRLGLRAKFKEGNIDKLEKKMRDYQKVLESGLLLRICNQNNALQLKMDNGFQQLDSTLRCFVEAISQGQANLQDLLTSNHGSIVEVIKAEFTVQNAATTVIASEVKKTQAMIKETSLEASLLSNDEHALDHVIDTFPDLKLKDFWGDWTLEDLERTMMDSLQAIATRPVFIFVDGLDEFGSSNASVDDDPRDLLDLVARLSTLDNVKMCVSSRPGPVFKNKLSGLCSLRLQDLTRSDMEKYAKAELLSNEVVGLENQKEYQELVNKLCNMADGVFLWTALAVRSLFRGLTNEDDISDLYARLDKMPAGLYPLYKDMWERLNDDRYLYRKEAALYFRLIIHWWRMPSHRSDKLFTTFHLLAALDPSISLAYLNHDTASFPSDLEATCEKLGKRVETRSAGLLEHGDYGSIDFIHRSALEFLTDTPEGQQIMAHDTSTFSELRSWLLQADVARAYLMIMKTVNPHFSGHWHDVRPNVRDLYADHVVEDVHFNWDDSALPGDVQIMLLEACRRMVEVGDGIFTPLWARSAELVVIECDTADAAELLTLGWARREAGTGENKAATVTDRDTIWRRAAGLKKSSPRVLAAGRRTHVYERGSHRSTSSHIDLKSVTHDDANRLLSQLENIRLTQDGRFFSIPELQDSLNEIWGRGNPLTQKEYLNLAGANSFNSFAVEYIRSFKNLTCSANHLPWLAKYREVIEEALRSVGTLVEDSYWLEVSSSWISS
ncbi:hypothetical protein GE21DRAFT_8519 [Neurospora crassa]|uniref:NACHT-NTPase and P-loop NTPases N-terminal domain-containing protein n=1 Tax=Neurospora crassa (strain ATCC 24698 / 74-OR23-1A / CBS 708.71 / DSM 1257 / FGSC 987) TaxID=367110 RepID=Q1K5W8_NEUCR|nr:hypothetical protein NCU07168 [Neurospora crassa OR74A]EAA28157.3 hypothetical protein NCU07168 [Neurospora crassa OR74A]KHE85807.1 hypothetical protein GE21DRAFT_8519 [Neurospora crassa]|eukprot:XP_957393.3 hypothetical protein NCU07168 [Neurospora crassa OR74A]